MNAKARTVLFWGIVAAIFASFDSHLINHLMAPLLAAVNSLPR